MLVLPALVMRPPEVIAPYRLLKLSGSMSCQPLPAATASESRWRKAGCCCSTAVRSASEAAAAASAARGCEASAPGASQLPAASSFASSSVKGSLSLYKLRGSSKFRLTGTNIGVAGPSWKTSTCMHYNRAIYSTIIMIMIL